MSEANVTGFGTCPFCQSRDVRPCRSLYETAKSYSRSSISRVAVTGGAGFYLDGANVRPTPETLMAAKFPPPAKVKFSWWLFLLAVICAAFLYFCLAEWVGISRWAALAICFAGLLAYYLTQHYILKKRLAIYRKEYEDWKSTSVCLSCEKAFISEKPADRMA